MSYHYTDTSREPQDCWCPCHTHPELPEATSADRCGVCHGTGRLGDPEAQGPSVLIEYESENLGRGNGWYYLPATLNPDAARPDWDGPFPTQAAALADARGENKCS